MDLNGDGRIDFGEFRIMMLEMLDTFDKQETKIVRLDTKQMPVEP